ncbi:piwi-like protein Siwi isoform X1 [Schistocerca americana]|uniref:piwi-like protein Siwi isoform X1 n=1 Tax=Schistocerca americana TaxID=7009 RepID=UPI001F4FA1E4|nr:piwi-like protein Siwi isoform X1 [Schistocerca americana]
MDARMEGTGRRGRARGRARGQTQPQEGGVGRMQQARGPGEGPPQPAPSQPGIGRAARAAATMHARRPGEGPVQPPETFTPPETGGRALLRGATSRPGGAAAGDGERALLEKKMEELAIGGDGNGAQVSVGRGVMRGRKVVSSEALKLRPEHLPTKKGTSGIRTTILTNYFKLETHTDWRLFQYRVDFAPEEDNTFVRKALLRVHKKRLGGFIFDGTVMFTSSRLSPDPNAVLELTSERKSDGAKIQIHIKFVGDLALGDYHYLQFFNILMRKCLGSLKLQLVGRNYFDAAARISVKEYRLELWPGYITSIRQHENSILMNSEINFKVMRQDTVLHIYTEICDKERDYQAAFKKAIVGVIVMTPYNNRTYRIDDVDFSKTPTHRFAKKTGEEITYKDYFKQKYDLTIRGDRQPLLVSRSKPRERRAGQADLIYLVPELCKMTGISDDMRANFHLMRALADHTRVAPEARIQKLLQFNERLYKEPEVVSSLTEWNMKLGRSLVDVEGRILPQEKIIQSATIKYDAGHEADWTRQLRSNPMFVCCTLKNWVVISPSRCMRDAGSFVQTLQRAAGGMRINMPEPYYQEIQDDRQGTYVEALEYVINSKNPQLIMCVVTNNRTDRYGAIKKKCCIDRAVPTQVILAKNLAAKGVMSIATKVAIQINCKLGGIPWTVEIPLSGMMTIGFDVCHDTTNRSRSYGALVASLDKQMSKYFSAVAPHASGEELSNEMTTNIIKALRKYQQVNQGSLPQRIFLYRDGVGEGQLHYVFEHEVALLKQRLQEVYGSAAFKLAVIIVTKRINTRLFLKQGNPPPGTVVDDVITNPSWYDFFIVSQSVRQGTVSPTAYNVISDNSGLDADKMQRLTYKLTHLYYNWSGTVRVPAPCQYAHKLAYLVGQALHRPPQPALEDLLYFL